MKSLTTFCQRGFIHSNVLLSFERKSFRFSIYLKTLLYFYNVNSRLLYHFKGHPVYEILFFDVMENLPSSLLINGFFGGKFFYGYSALRASNPPKDFFPQNSFINNLDDKFPFTSKGSLMINVSIPNFEL